MTADERIAELERSVLALREALENEFPADIGTGYRARTPKAISAVLTDTAAAGAAAEARIRDRVIREFGMRTDPEKCPACGEAYFRHGEMDVVLYASAEFREKHNARIRANERERAADLADRIEREHQWLKTHKAGAQEALAMVAAALRAGPQT